MSDSAPEPIIYDNAELQQLEKERFYCFPPQPYYRGGEEAMMKFITDNFKIPVYERENTIQGRIVVGFVIDEKSEVTNAEIKKGLSVGLDNEALRVISLLRFKPALQNGNPVKFNYLIPILVNYEKAKSKKHSH